MNEMKQTFFQIPPSRGCVEDYYSRDYVMYLNEVFKLSDVFYVSAVESLAVQLYRFSIELERYDEPNKVLTFEFPKKEDALKAQRELARCLTRTGDFKHECPSTKEESVHTE